MSTRLRSLTVKPWIGGWVTAQDESLIGPDNLTRADNIFYSTQGTRRQREGVNADWDNLDIVSVSRSSSGTTRTIVTTGYRWTVGDQVIISGAGNSSYNVSTATNVTAVSTTSTTNDTFSYSASGSLAEGSTADTGITITLKTRIIALHDYWYGSTSAKTHVIMAFSSTGQLFSINPTTGARTRITDTGTAYTIPSGGIPRASMCTFENRLIVACEGTSNKMKHYMPAALGGSGDLEDIANTTNYAATPVASFVRTHLGRLWCNDQANPDRLHYSETGSYNVWQGAGDSGALDVGSGDGDPEGLTAIFPPFRNFFFVAKRGKLYRIDGQFPELFSIIKISDDLGCVAHQAVAAIDQDDVVFVSDKGVHSIVATQEQGSFLGAYVSLDIQPTFNELTYGRLKYIQAAYIGQFNTLVLCVAESGDTEQNQLYMFNVAQRKWFRWPSISCTSIVVVKDIDQQRFFLGQDNGRIAKTFTGTNADTAAAGVTSSVQMSLSTGLIFPVEDFSVDIAYKKLALIIKATGSYTVTCNFTIDNFSSQAVAFSSTNTSDLLGSTFILGSSLLGQTRVTAAYTQPVDGLGRGFKFTITQTGSSAELDLIGYQVFYEPSEYTQETRAGDSA